MMNFLLSQSLWTGFWSTSQKWTKTQCLHFAYLMLNALYTASHHDICHSAFQMIKKRVSKLFCGPLSVGHGPYFENPCPSAFHINSLNLPTSCCATSCCILCRVKWQHTPCNNNAINLVSKKNNSFHRFLQPPRKQWRLIYSNIPTTHFYFIKYN